jgi:predicted glutamine amidotransferase
MCRLFALRASRPSRVADSLVESPCSLLRQSGCDRRGQCHDNGWGIGWYDGGRPQRRRAPLGAKQDPHYRAVANAVCAATVLGHVRQASVGGVSALNTHPFIQGSWLFAHNGTLEGFGSDPDRLRRLIPLDLIHSIEGETDSEHLFHFLLGRMRPLLNAPDRAATADSLAGLLLTTVGELGELFPGTEAAPSRLNFVLTDGQTLVAARWGHTLFWLRQREATATDAADGQAPVAPSIAVASEPTTTDLAWAEIPDRSVLLIRPDLTHAVTPITAPAP